MPSPVSAAAATVWTPADFPDEGTWSIDLTAADRAALIAAGRHGDTASLAEHFRDVVPHRGRYVRQSAKADERGVIYLPPPVGLTKAQMAIGVGAVIGAGVLAARRLAARR